MTTLASTSSPGDPTRRGADHDAAGARSQHVAAPPAGWGGTNDALAAPRLGVEAAPRAGAESVSGQVQTHTDITYYDVSGDNVTALRAQLDRLSPADGSGARYDAYTTWHIAWSWPVTADGTCRLRAATVSVGITLRLPRWLPPAGAPAWLVHDWQRYVAALQTHEQGHLDLVERSAPSVLAAIQGASCATAGAAAHAVSARIQQLNDAYDAATDHGATQGARFP